MAGGWGWFTHVARLSRTDPPQVLPAADLPDIVAQTLTAPRSDLGPLSMDRPRIMAVLNTTPDSFSDGGRFDAPEAAQAQGERLIADGADILDVGGESTHPGAVTVPQDVEIARTAPIIRALRKGWQGVISVDTRKADVARTALWSGATMLNDVSALDGTDNMARVAADADVPICLMHAQGPPQTMQVNPGYDDVLLDVYDYLAARIAMAESCGVARHRITVDPGVGFGKTLEHNLRLLANLSLFHGLGCPVLLGASRKRFIGTLSGTVKTSDRMPGSVAVALAAIAQGVQIVRVHDMAETKQALALWRAATEGGSV